MKESTKLEKMLKTFNELVENAIENKEKHEKLKDGKENKKIQ